MNDSIYVVVVTYLFEGRPHIVYYCDWPWDAILAHIEGCERAGITLVTMGCPVDSEMRPIR